MVRAIREYYTWDQAQECVDTWNQLELTEQAQHILACSPFRAQVILAQEILRKQSEMRTLLDSEQWANMLKTRKERNER